MDQWASYRASLRGEHVSIHDGAVQSGFYWAKASKSGGRIPVAVWRSETGEFNCRIGARATAKMIDRDTAADRWTRFASNPVSREDYTHAYTTGTWPDGTPTTAPDLPAGSNLPTDPFDRLKAEVEDVIEKAGGFLRAAGAETAGQIDKTKADMARNIQAEVLALAATADAQHKAEKKPHLDASRAVDDKFRFREPLKQAAEKLRSVFETWMRAEEFRQRAEAERAFKAEQARVAAERARIAAEEQRQYQDDPIAALTSPPVALPEMPAAPPPVKVNVGGGRGRAAGLKSVWVHDIADYPACLAHFAEHPAVREAVEKIVAAQVRAMKGETKIPGVSVKEERRAA